MSSRVARSSPLSAVVQDAVVWGGVQKRRNPTFSRSFSERERAIDHALEPIAYVTSKDLAVAMETRSSVERCTEAKYTSEVWQHINDSDFRICLYVNNYYIM